MRGKIFSEKMFHEDLGEVTVYYVESRSRPGTFHRVIADSYGLRCDCLGFRYRGRCRHVEAVSELLRREDSFEKKMEEIRKTENPEEKLEKLCSLLSEI